ncbi:hypothetical protein QQF64_018941 [Cirrhinus molitorella]|uniref:Uncharacterized protein n=1 Tax=Cirrhinus molitorella TaxID=172907 RepID=A0ABR3LFH9_9TELE
MSFRSLRNAGNGSACGFSLLCARPEGKKTPLSTTALQPPALIPENQALSCLMDSIPVYPCGMSTSTDAELGERVFVPHACLKKTPTSSDCLPPRIVALLCVLVSVWSCLAESEAITCSLAFPR